MSDLMKSSRIVLDMIEQFDFGASPELMASRLLDILQAINNRMDQIESIARHANNVAGCLANGIQPD